MTTSMRNAGRLLAAGPVAVLLSGAVLAIALPGAPAATPGQPLPLPKPYDLATLQF